MKLTNIIHRILYFFKYLYLKTFNFKNFYSYPILNIYPSCSFVLGKNSDLIIGKNVGMRNRVKVQTEKNAKIVIGDNVFLILKKGVILDLMFLYMTMIMIIVKG